MKDTPLSIKIIGGIVGIVILAVIVNKAQSLMGTVAAGEVSAPAVAATMEEAVSVSVETVGEGQIEGFENMSISWPGEIISLGDIEVQPQREGTIVEWRVNIGQRVFKGQVLGTLSAPPRTPELVKMLAEQAEALDRARGQAQATSDFRIKNVAQLSTLREALQKNIASVNSALNNPGGVVSGDILAASRAALKQSQNAFEAKQQNIRKTIERILNRHMLKMTNVTDPHYFSNLSLRYELGRLLSMSRTAYETAVYKLVSELKSPDAIPVLAAKDYLQATLKLLNSSTTSEYLSQSDLDELRTMVNEDQGDLLEALQEYEKEKSELSMQGVEYKARDIEYGLIRLEQGKDYAEQIKEIDEKIAMLEREEQMALVEVRASELAYKTIVGNFTSGLNIVAPQNGVISAIYKKNGDFVEPGMSVASVNNGDRNKRFVRFRIPSNLPLPELGTLLTIIRPGYPHERKEAKLIGIGSALDGNGAYLADAQWLEPIDWPVRNSVRVLPPSGLIPSVLIYSTAVWWDETAQPNVWLVTEEDRIRPQPIKTGRMVGDRIEVAEGLQQGNRYVSKATIGLVRGMALKNIKAKTNQKSEEHGKEADSHGHDE